MSAVVRGGGGRGKGRLGGGIGFDDAGGIVGRTQIWFMVSI